MAGRVYLMLGDFEGPVNDDNVSKAIECKSVSIGVANSMNCAEKVQGNPGGEAHHHSPVAISKVIDKLSPQLAVHCALGSGFDKAEIQVWEEQELLYTVTLEKVCISSYDVVADASGVPHESITLGYALAAYKYKDGADDHFNLAKDSSSLEKKAFSDAFEIS